MKNRVLNINQMVHLKELGVDTSKASMVIIARDEYGDEIEWSNLSYKKDTDTFMYDSWDDDSDQPSPKEAYLEYLDAEDGEYDHSYRKENGAFILQDILELLPSRIEDPCFTLIARMDKRPPYLISAKETFDSVPDFVKIDKNGNVFIEVYDTDIPIVVKIKEFMVKNKIIDILMRMLEISELKRIMGFPEKYILKGTKVKQKKYIGNAVEVGMSRSLCIALVNNRIKLKQKIA